MPVNYRILPEFNLVLVHFQGEVGAQEHIDSFRKYTDEPQFDGRQHILLDLSECRFDTTYFREMQQLAYLLKGYYQVRAHTSKTAVWAPGDVVFGMSRMYQAISEGDSPWELGIFRTKVEALEFLGFAQDSPQEAAMLREWQ